MNKETMLKFATALENLLEEADFDALEKIMPYRYNMAMIFGMEKQLKIADRIISKAFDNAVGDKDNDLHYYTRIFESQLKDWRATFKRMVRSANPPKIDYAEDLIKEGKDVLIEYLNLERRYNDEKVLESIYAEARKHI